MTAGLEISGVSVVGMQCNRGEAREQALDRMVDEARELGANAIVGTRFMTSMLMAGAAELLAYGTAVVLEYDPETE